MSSSASNPGGQTLERGAIGLTEVLFQSITHMAPAVATALSIGAATLFAGGNAPAVGRPRAHRGRVHGLLDR